MIARRDLWAALEEEHFDLLVIGGGITGAGVAHLAARRGLRVALIERVDFAGGTSGRTSRLIHGGLRYLLHGQVRFVRRSLAEQVRLAQALPRLIRPQAFLLPLYSDAPVSPSAIRFLMSVYHVLRPIRGRQPYQHLTARETIEKESLLRRDRLLGGLLYGEFSTHDARLVVETILGARAAGAVTLNYAGLVNFLVSGGRVVGGLVQDQVSGRRAEVRARAVINAAGPWSDALARALDPTHRRLRLSKGAHAVLSRSRLPLAQGVSLLSPRDGRAFMVRPDGDLVFAGPTETEYEGDPSAVSADAADRDYLLETLDLYFPEAHLGSGDVIAMTAGVRPLSDQSSRPAGEVSRSYDMVWAPPGLLSVLGGKLTLHRRAAQEALRFLASRTGGDAGPARDDGRGHLAGAAGDSPGESVVQALRDGALSPETATHFLQTYGSRAPHLFRAIRDDPEGREPIVPGLPHVWAELPFAIEHEMAVRPEDYLWRRTDLALQAAARARPIPDRVRTEWAIAAEKVLLALTR